MSHLVGAKGQVVIEKEIRDRLGVQPGWGALQQLVDDHVEIFFVPPEHSESLLGILAPYTNVIISDEDFHDERERAWEDHVRERFDEHGDRT